MESEKSLAKGIKKLSTSKALHDGRFKDFLKEALSELVVELDCARAGFWSYRADEKDLKAICLYDKIWDTFTEHNILSNAEFPNFIEAVASIPIMSTEDAEKNKQTSELTDKYLAQNAIKSLLTYQVWHQGNLIGIICLEHARSKKKWSDQDQVYLAQVASYIMQSFSIQCEKKGANTESGDITDTYALFNDGAVAMYIYDLESLKILDANHLATTLFGYELSKFKGKSVYKLSPESASSELDLHFKGKQKNKWMKYEWPQEKSDQTVFNAEIIIGVISYLGKQTGVAMVIDVPQIGLSQKEEPTSLPDFSDHASFISHHIRRPLSAILALIDLIKLSWEEKENYEELLHNLKLQSMDLDDSIRILNTKMNQST